MLYIRHASLVEESLNTRQCSWQHDKSSEQRQALYSGVEGSTRTLFLSPLLNTLPSPPTDEHSCACVKIWTSSSSSSPLCPPRMTDSSLLLYPSLYLQYSRRSVFLPSLYYSRFTFHSVHLSVSPLSYFHRQQCMFYVQYVCCHPESCNNAIWSKYWTLFEVAARV